MANLATHYEEKEIIQKIVQRNELLNAVESLLLSCDDPIVLMEVLRLVTVGICTPHQRENLDPKKVWLELATKESSLLQMVSIFKNTLHNGVFERVSSLILHLLYNSKGDELYLQLLEQHLMGKVLSQLIFDVINSDKLRYSYSPFYIIFYLNINIFIYIPTKEIIV